MLYRDEGCRLKVYADSLGHPTIGVGRALDTKGISQLEADYLLDNDIRDCTSDLIAELPWTATIDEIRRAALVNLVFNVGIHGVLGFKKALAALERHDWETGARELLDSKWRKQVGIRADRVAEQIRTGRWAD